MSTYGAHLESSGPSIAPGLMATIFLATATSAAAPIEHSQNSLYSYNLRTTAASYWTQSLAGVEPVGGDECILITTLPYHNMGLSGSTANENPVHLALLREVGTYEALEDGWDGYGGSSPNPEAMADLRAFLGDLPSGIDYPSITLASSGLPSLYWDADEFFADLEFFGGGASSLYFVSKRTDDKEFSEFADVAGASAAIARALDRKAAA